MKAWWEGDVQKVVIEYTPITDEALVMALL
jgi:hypothetical protein